MRVIRQNVPLKITEFNLVWRRHVGVQLKYTNMATGNEWQHLEFTLAIFFKHFLLSAKLANIRMHTSLIILAVQTTKTQGESLFSCN